MEINSNSTLPSVMEFHFHSTGWCYTALGAHGFGLPYLEFHLTKGIPSPIDQGNSRVEFHKCNIESTCPNIIPEVEVYMWSLCSRECGVFLSFYTVHVSTHNCRYMFSYSKTL